MHVEEVLVMILGRVISVPASLATHLNPSLLQRLDFGPISCLLGLM